MKPLLIDYAEYDWLPWLKYFSIGQPGWIWSDRDPQIFSEQWLVEDLPNKLSWNWRVRQAAKRGCDHWIILGAAPVKLIMGLAEKCGGQVSWLLTPDIIETAALEAKTWSRRPKVWALSRAWCDALVATGWPETMVGWLPPTIEDDALSQPSGFIANRRSDLVIGVQLNHPNSSIEKLLSAIASAKVLGLSIRLLVIGSGVHKERLAWLLKAMSLSDRVHLVGDRSELIPWFKDLDLWTVANQPIGLDDLRSAALAAAHGLPLLLPSDQTFGDILVPETNGEKVDWQLTDEVVSILKRWANNRLLLYDYGQAGRRLVKEQFIWSAVQKYWKALLNYR